MGYPAQVRGSAPPGISEANDANPRIAKNVLMFRDGGRIRPPRAKEPTHRGVPLTAGVSADEALTVQHEVEKIVLTKDSPFAAGPATKAQLASIPGANPQDAGLRLVRLPVAPGSGRWPPAPNTARSTR